MKEKNFFEAFTNLFRSGAKARRAPGSPSFHHRASPLRFEALESRLLLSADLVGSTFDSAHDLVLRDADGTRVTFRLSGAGSGSVIADGNAWDVVLTGTNAQTSFSVRARGGDGRVTLDDVSVGGAIMAIDAPNAHLTGTLATDGPLGLGLLLGGANGATIATSRVGLSFFGFSLGGIVILKDLVDSEVLIGADLGADGQRGGTGANADTFGQGSLPLLAVLGSVNDSFVRVGQDPVNGIFDDCDDVIRGNADSRIGCILIGDELTSDSRIIAGRLPAWAFVDGRVIRTAGDPRFKTDVEGPEVDLALANDTGGSTADGLTFDPSIAGNVIDAGGIDALWAGFGGSANVDISDELAADGSFLLSRSDLEEIYGAPLVDGSYTLTIEATDAQGNGCPHTVSFTLDSTSPTVTINQAPGQEDPASGGPILFTVEFSEAVTGFSGADLSFAGSTVGSGLVAEVTGSGTTYTVSVTGMNGTGTVVASIPAGAAADAAGNTSSASSSTDNSVTFGSGSNQAPVAGEDFFTSRPGQEVLITFAQLLDDDTDADGDALRVVSVDSQMRDAMGNVVADVITDLAAGTIRVVPTVPFFTGAGRFNYRIEDAFGNEDDGEVTLTYVNQAPVAGDDSFTWRPGQTEVITFAQLLDDDTDADGDVLRLVDVDRQVRDENDNVVAEVVEVNFELGTLVVAPSVQFFTGTGRFSYRVTDDFGGFDAGEVTLTYVNQAPVAVDDSFVADEDVALVIAASALTANDTDADADVRTVTAVQAGVDTHGTVTLSGGMVIYTPDPNYSGIVSFGYTVSDGFGGSDSGLVSITLNPANDAPVALDDSFVTDEDVALVIAASALTANDSDADADVLTITVQAGVDTHGTVTLADDGTVTYTPDANYNGTVSFGYTVSDGFGGSDSGLVSITLNPVNDAPVAQGESIQLSAGPEALITFEQLLENDTDVDGDALRVVVSVGDQVLDVMGNVAVAEVIEVNFDMGYLVVAPLPGFELFTGEGRFSYQVTDGVALPVVGEVTIDYVENQAPMVGAEVSIELAFELDAEQRERAVITFAQLLADDTDPDGDALSVVGVWDRRVMDVMGNIVAEVMEVNFDMGYLVVERAAGFEFFTGTAGLRYRVADHLGSYDDGEQPLFFPLPAVATGQSVSISTDSPQLASMPSVNEEFESGWIVMPDTLVPDRRYAIDWNARPDAGFMPSYMVKRSSGSGVREF